MIRSRKHPQFWLLAALIGLVFQASLVHHHPYADRLLGIHRSPLGVRHSPTLPSALRQSPSPEPAGSKGDAPFLSPEIFQIHPENLAALVSAGYACSALDGTPHGERGRSPPLS